VFGPDGQSVSQLGLNLGVVCNLLRRFGIAENPCGAAHLRWNRSYGLPSGASNLPFGVLIFLRQVVKAAPSIGWVEQSLTLKCYVSVSGKEPVELEGKSKRSLVEGLFDATVKTKPEEFANLIKDLATNQALLLLRLQRPTDDELKAGIRYGVTPLFCAMVTA
jgi:hypothetical protein